jgi:hypothetical protein
MTYVVLVCCGKKVKLRHISMCFQLMPLCIGGFTQHERDTPMPGFVARPQLDDFRHSAALNDGETRRLELEFTAQSLQQSCAISQPALLALDHSR